MDKGPPYLLPQIDLKTGIIHSPHVVIVGAGASRACCPSGDADERPLPVMADLVAQLSLQSIIEAAGHDPSQNFETIYSDIHSAGDAATIKILDQAVRTYFSGVRIPDRVTVYDYLLLSMRPKDLIVSFNWDPLLPQAYRRWRRLGAHLPELTFPHGNVDLVVDRDAKRVKFSCDVERNEAGFEPCRLLYPVREKNYSDDPFVADQWARAKDFLERAYYVTVFGYSAPKTDVEARRLLLDAWTSNRTMMLGQFDVVDIAEKAKLKEAWGEFIVKTHGGYLDDIMQTFPMRNPRRTCENFGFMTLQSQPRHDDPFPQLTDLRELERWITPLITEEETGHLAGEPLH